MGYSEKLFNMAVSLAQSIKEDSKKLVDRNEIRAIRDQKEGKRWQIVRDLLLLSLKTSKDYEKCERVFDILDPGNQISFKSNLHMEIENLVLCYDIEPMLHGMRDTVAQIVCSWDVKKKGWDIYFIRFKEFNPKILDRYLPSIQEVISVRNQ